MKIYSAFIYFLLGASSFALGSETPRHNLYCQVGLMGHSKMDFISINSSRERDEKELGYGNLVRIMRIDESRFLIEITKNAILRFSPTLLDARKTIQLAMSAEDALVLCKPQVASE